VILKKVQDGITGFRAIRVTERDFLDVFIFREYLDKESNNR